MGQVKTGGMITKQHEHSPKERLATSSNTGYQSQAIIKRIKNPAAL